MTADNPNKQGFWQVVVNLTKSTTKALLLPFIIILNKIIKNIREGKVSFKLQCSCHYIQNMKLYLMDIHAAVGTTCNITF